MIEGLVELVVFYCICVSIVTGFVLVTYLKYITGINHIESERIIKFSDDYRSLVWQLVKHTSLIEISKPLGRGDLAIEIFKTAPCFIVAVIIFIVFIVPSSY